MYYSRLRTTMMDQNLHFLTSETFTAQVCDIHKIHLKFNDVHKIPVKLK